MNEMLFLQANPVSTALNSVSWIFPASEIFHIVGFGVSIGTIALIDVSLLGVGLRRKGTPQLLKNTAPWTLIALVIVILAGLILFLHQSARVPRESQRFSSKSFVWF